MPLHLHWFYIALRLVLTDVVRDRDRTALGRSELILGSVSTIIGAVVLQLVPSVVVLAATRFVNVKSRLQKGMMACRRANSPLKSRISIRMIIRTRISTFVLGLTMALGAPLAFGQQTSSSDTAKQDMRSAGQQTKGAAKDAGRGVKKGTKKTYHSTKKGTQKAWNKTRNTTKGAVDGGKAGAKRPD